MAKAQGEVFCEYCGWTRSYEVDGMGEGSSGAACAAAREHGLTCEKHPLVQELRREKARTPDHRACRETEQKLREANRRLQQEGPALERDKLIVQLRARIAELEQAIVTHRAQKADDRCIEDDDRLYAALGDGVPCDRRVGDKEAMLANCKRFIEQRCEAGGPWKSYAELEQENRRLNERLARHRCIPQGWHHSPEDF